MAKPVKDSSKKKATGKKTTKRAYPRPPTGRKGGPLGKIAREQIKDEIITLIESGLIHGQSTVQLAKKFKVSYETYNKLEDEVWNNIKPKSVQHTFLEFDKLFDRLFRESYKLLQDVNSPKEKLEVIKTINNMIDKRTDILERFFVKAKASENVTVQGLVGVADLGKIEVEIIDVPMKKIGGKES